MEGYLDYVMVVSVPRELLTGDETIDNASQVVNDLLEYEAQANSTASVTVRPLSEVIAS